MGFLEGFGRFMRGETIFQPPAQQDTVHGRQGEESSAQQSAGSKVIPKVEVEDTEAHINGTHLRVTARIKNHSGGRIELDKIRLLNTKRELDTWLSPHEEKDFIVYEGPAMTHANYDDAWLDYKDATGDYFQQYHTVELRQESQGTFTVYRIQSAGPIKDI